MRTLAKPFYSLLLLLLASEALGHDSRPLFIELKEIQTGIVRMQWKVPPSVPATNLPEVILPANCQLQGKVGEIQSSGGSLRNATYLCAEDLSGQVLTIRYPGANPSLSTLVRYYGASGQQHTSVLGPAETSWTVPDAENPSMVIGHYTLLGIEHIWAGIDHLLFLVCLLWIAGTGQRILITVTGFTLAHSLTLVISTLGVVRVPVAPVEACIALSIVFLATEMAKESRVGLTWRYPIAVSSSFGLLHGFGFANALNEVGLPQTEIPLALLFFNVGVEIGQLIFVLVVIGLGVAGRFCLGGGTALSALCNWIPRVQTAVIYGVGALAGFWLVERTYSFL